MGRLTDELRDPWGPLVASVVGGLAWAVGTPLLAAAGVAAAVYGIKAALGAALGSGDDPRRLPAPPRPPQGTPASFWLGRAERAVRSLHTMADQSDRTTPAGLATARSAEEADGVLVTMRRLGGHVVAVGSALGSSDAPGLDEEAQRLQQRARSAPQDASAQSSAKAVADRVAVRDRLRVALAELEGRLQSSALGLEGLVARVAEVRATAASVGDVDISSGSLASLSAELDGLRLGLEDVDQVATRALGGVP